MVKRKRKEERNAMIIERYKKGDKMAEIARFFNLTRQRVWQIIKYYNSSS